MFPPFLFLTAATCRCFLFVIFLAACYSSSLVLPFPADLSASLPICSSQTLLSFLALRLTSLTLTACTIVVACLLPSLISCCVCCRHFSAAGVLFSRSPLSTTVCFSFSFGLIRFGSYCVYFLHLFTVFVDIFFSL